MGRGYQQGRRLSVTECGLDADCTVETSGLFVSFKVGSITIQSRFHVNVDTLVCVYTDYLLQICQIAFITQNRKWVDENKI